MMCNANVTTCYIKLVLYVQNSNRNGETVETERIYPGRKKQSPKPSKSTRTYVLTSLTVGCLSRRRLEVDDQLACLIGQQRHALDVVSRPGRLVQPHVVVHGDGGVV